MRPPMMAMRPAMHMPLAQRSKRDRPDQYLPNASKQPRVGSIIKPITIEVPVLDESWAPKLDDIVEGTVVSAIAKTETELSEAEKALEEATSNLESSLEVS